MRLIKLIVLGFTQSGPENGFRSAMFKYAWPQNTWLGSDTLHLVNGFQMMGFLFDNMLDVGIIINTSERRMARHITRSYNSEVCHEI